MILPAKIGVALVGSALTAGLAVAISPNGIVETGSKIGTANNQTILGILVSISLFGIAALWRTMWKMHAANSTAQNEFMQRLDKKEESMATERISRIERLMAQQKEQVEVNKDLHHALENNNTALETNTKTIDKLEEVMNRLLERLPQKTK